LPFGLVGYVGSPKSDFWLLKCLPEVRGVSALNMDVVDVGLPQSGTQSPTMLTFILESLQRLVSLESAIAKPEKAAKAAMVDAVAMSFFIFDLQCDFSGLDLDTKFPKAASLCGSWEK
jgi:hypothetical protein